MNQEQQNSQKQQMTETLKQVAQNLCEAKRNLASVMPVIHQSGFGIKYTQLMDMTNLLGSLTIYIRRVDQTVECLTKGTE